MLFVCLKTRNMRVLHASRSGDRLRKCSEGIGVCPTLAADVHKRQSRCPRARTVLNVVQCPR